MFSRGGSRVDGAVTAPALTLERYLGLDATSLSPSRRGERVDVVVNDEDQPPSEWICSFFAIERRSTRSRDRLEFAQWVTNNQMITSLRSFRRNKRRFNQVGKAQLVVLDDSYEAHSFELDKSKWDRKEGRSVVLNESAQDARLLRGIDAFEARGLDFNFTELRWNKFEQSRQGILKIKSQIQPRV